MIETLSALLGFDLTQCNPDLVLMVSALFLVLVVSFLYDLALLLFGYIGGKRR